MKLLIEIPEKTYHMINTGTYDYGDMNIIIQNGTPLPKGHGRLIDADKLLRFFTVDTANQTYRFGTIKKQIENAETVQAIPIPDNATNYDVLKAVFGNNIAFRIKDKMEFEKGFEFWFSKPYT